MLPGILLSRGYGDATALQRQPSGRRIDLDGTES
jgi:hypothetical protein